MDVAALARCACASACWKRQTRSRAECVEAQDEEAEHCGARGGRCKRLMEYFGSSSEAMEGIIVLIYLWWFLICNRVLNTKTKWSLSSILRPRFFWCYFHKSSSFRCYKNKFSLKRMSNRSQGCKMCLPNWYIQENKEIWCHWATFFPKFSNSIL